VGRPLLHPQIPQSSLAIGMYRLPSQVAEAASVPCHDIYMKITIISSLSNCYLNRESWHGQKGRTHRAVLLWQLEPICSISFIHGYEGRVTVFSAASDQGRDAFEIPRHSPPRDAARTIPIVVPVRELESRPPIRIIVCADSTSEDRVKANRVANLCP